MLTDMKKNISDQQVQEAWDYWYPLVYGYFFKRINSRTDVEDLTSITITALLTRDDVSNPKGFIWQTARNQVLKYIKEKSNTPNFVAFDDVNENFLAESFQSTPGYDTHEDSEPEVINPWYLEKKSRLIECIENNLKIEEQEVVKLSLIQEKNSTEIGQMLNLKPATVRQKLKRSIQKLHDKCKETWDKAGFGLLLFIPGLRMQDETIVAKKEIVSTNPYLPAKLEEEPWQFLFEENKVYKNSKRIGLAALLANLGFNPVTNTDLLGSKVVKNVSKLAKKNAKKTLLLALVSATITAGLVASNRLNDSAELVGANDQIARKDAGLIPSPFDKEINLENVAGIIEEIQNKEDEKNTKSNPDQIATINPGTNPQPSQNPDPTPDPTPDLTPPVEPAFIITPTFQATYPACTGVFIPAGCPVDFVLAPNPNFTSTGFSTQSITQTQTLGKTVTIRNCLGGNLFFTDTELDQVKNNTSTTTKRGCMRNESSVVQGKTINFNKGTAIMYFIEESIPTAKSSDADADTYHPAGASYGVRRMRVHKISYNDEAVLLSSSRIFTKTMYYDLSNSECDPRDYDDLNDILCVLNKPTLESGDQKIIDNNLLYQDISRTFSKNGNLTPTASMESKLDLTPIVGREWESFIGL
jgi:RNA polymerase sigma factor (sigma-70 family)